MYLGRIVELAPRQMLFTAPLHPYSVALLSAIPLPDPPRERGRKRVMLKGETPDPSAVPAGCRFHPRCPLMIDDCKAIDPALEPPAAARVGDHRAACIRV
jgi:oligopeptide/dipeptide ABC transporter ATP-binding protein